MPQVVFSNPTSPVTQVLVSSSPTATGTYTFQLSADDTQFVSTSIVHLTVNAANQPPVVSAGSAQTLYTTLNGLNVPLAISTNLQGAATDDGLPNGTLTLQWTTFSGPGAVTFANPGAAATSATFPQPGNYVLALTANDSQLSTTALVQVTVLVNQPPVVVMPAPYRQLSAPGR